MIGNRIKQARQARGLTLQDVVDRLAFCGIEITRAGLSKYEQGKSRPSQAFLKSLANELGFSTSVFLDDGSVDVQWYGFRKQAKLPKKLQEHVKANATFRIEAQLRLERLLHPHGKPEFPKPQVPADLNDVERIATETREYWSLGVATIQSLTDFVESHGMLVVAHEGEDRGREFDGLCGWLNGSVPIAVISASAPSDRIRFTLAHEIGHLAMDCQRLDESEEEVYVHRFASAFLVPDVVLRDELGEQRRKIAAREFAELKRKHGLSMGALVRRAKDLEIISAALYTSICKEFSQFGWRKKEPVEYEVNERPKRLGQMLLRALAEGMISDSDANRIIPDIADGIVGESSHLSHGLLQRPRSERQDSLARAAESVAEIYASDPELTDFDAFAEE